MSPSPRDVRTLASAALCALAAAVGCADRRSAPAVVSVNGAPTSDADGAAAAAVRIADSVQAAEGSGEHARSVFASQIGAFADSAAARRYGDSLTTEGWDVMLRRVTGYTLPPWRVRVAPTQDRDLALAVVAGLAAGRRYVQLVRDNALLPSTRVLV